MYDCPTCGFEMNRPTRRVERRTNSSPGRKSTGVELVACPECGQIIDGFTPH